MLKRRAQGQKSDGRWSRRLWWSLTILLLLGLVVAGLVQFRRLRQLPEPVTTLKPFSPKERREGKRLAARIWQSYGGKLWSRVGRVKLLWESGTSATPSSRPHKKSVLSAQTAASSRPVLPSHAVKDAAAVTNAGCRWPLPKGMVVASGIVGSPAGRLVHMRGLGKPQTWIVQPDGVLKSGAPSAQPTKGKLSMTAMWRSVRLVALLPLWLRQASQVGLLPGGIWRGKRFLRLHVAWRSVTRSTQRTKPTMAQLWISRNSGLVRRLDLMWREKGSGGHCRESWRVSQFRRVRGIMLPSRWERGLGLPSRNAIQVLSLKRFLWLP